MTKEQVKSAALQLDPSERQALAEELLLSIDGEQSSTIDAAWLDEVRRRDDDFSAGHTSSTRGRGDRSPECRGRSVTATILEQAEADPKA